ncbi:MAG TPA: hypothetical protein VJQ55_06385 [Candidatus Binatia bacterium]|nr:hypothetical protein [Candidatus Binatia bacterium]
MCSEDNAGPDATVTALTIAGISASSVAVLNNGTEQASLWVAAVPSGTTSNIVITFANAAYAVGICIWALYGASATATDSGGDTDSNPATYALDTNTGGVAVAFGVHRSNTDATFIWSNLTEDFDQVVDTGDITMSGASAAFVNGQTDLAISLTSSQSGVRNPVMVVASFPPL